MGATTSFLAAFSAYYLICGVLIYVKAAPWRRRPPPPPRVGSDDGDAYSPPNPSDDDASSDGRCDEESATTTPPPTPHPNGSSDRRREEKQELARRRQRPSIFRRLGSRQSGGGGPDDVNPFYSDCWHLTEWARIKMTLCGPILLPSRAVAMGTFVLLASILSSVAVAGLPRKKFECGSTAPLSWWRRAFLAPVRLLLRLALFSMGYLYIEEEGKRAPLKESPIVVANHLGPIEPLILAVRTGGMPVSKIENMSLPFFGAVAKLFLPILVDRNDDNSRKAVAAEIESRARRAADGTFRGPVFLFPEGTTTNGTSVITFKAGAFAPRLPVQPVVVRFPHAPGHFAPIWTAVSPSLPELFFRMLCEPVNRCKISWLPVASPVGEEEKTGDWPGPKLYASRVQTIVADAMGGTTTRFAFEDVRLMNRAKQLVGKRSALATSGAAIEFKSMQEELVDLNLDDAMRYLQRFSEADRSGSGNLTLEEFEAAFGDRMSSETLRRVFDLLDDDRSGRLDFREFLVGASLLHASSEKMLEDALQFCFTVFDTKNEGKLDFRDAQRILRVVHSDVEEEALRKTFDSMDENGNGFLDKEEFVNWVKRNEETLPAIRELLFV